MRVLGARLVHVGRLVVVNFLLIAMIACLVSWPIVTYFMDGWLSEFAYSIDLSPLFLIKTVGLVLLVTIITLAFQVRRVVVTNPTVILKNE